MVKRLSPVQFDAVVAEAEARHGWGVVLEYRNEGEGPWLVDLSHRQRWDFQHTHLDSQQPFGLAVPAKPGQTRVKHDLLISRMNGTQAAIWHLGRDEPGFMPRETGWTEMTDAQCMLAVLGADTPRVMEHVSNLDLFNPAQEMPFLTQGPVLHVPCQVVTLGLDGVVMTFSRGYGQTFADAMLHAASGCHLIAGGENRFNNWWF